MKVYCKDCDYWNGFPDRGGDSGECRYKPPQVINNEVVGWLTTSADSWCGAAFPAEEDTEEDSYQRGWKAGYEDGVRDSMIQSSNLLEKRQSTKS